MCIAHLRRVNSHAGRRQEGPGGNIARAAREAELDRKHLYSLLHKYGLVQSEGD